MTAMVSVGVVAPVHAFDVPSVLKDGWRTRVKVSGVADIGSSRTSSVSLSGEFDYRRGRFETQLDARYQRSDARVDVVLADADGTPVLDPQGLPITDEVSERTRDRRFLSIEPRWYFNNNQLFAFGLLDVDRDRPAGVELSTREVVGVGYRLWADKNNFLAGGFGVGFKRFEDTENAASESGIGYVGVKLALDTSERTRVRAELDSDFGGENDFTEFSLSLGFKVSETVGVSLGYEARVNGALRDGGVSDADGLDSRFEFGLQLDFP